MATPGRLQRENFQLFYSPATVNMMYEKLDGRRFNWENFFVLLVQKAGKTELIKERHTGGFAFFCLTEAVYADMPFRYQISFQDVVTAVMAEIIKLDGQIKAIIGFFVSAVAIILFFTLLDFWYRKFDAKTKENMQSQKDRSSITEADILEFC